MLDPRIEIVRKEYGLSQDDFWKLPQGRDVWLVKHAALEVVAAKAGITFDMPEILEAKSGEGVTAICVRGYYGDRSIWSIGEANPKNCKNSYPWAIAEKRAIDRVVLKLVGLHGLVYSEEESDDFKPNTTPPKQVSRDDYADDNRTAAIKSSAQLKRDGFWPDFERELLECSTLLMLEKFKTAWRKKAMDDGWNAAFKAAAKDRIEGQEKAILDAMDAAELADVPLDKALQHSIQNHPLMAGE